MPTSEQRPNILVICSDEHHPRIAGYRGNRWVKTPNLDGLARDGAHFTRAYCTSPVCTPSRMSFISGKYVHQIDNWMIGIPLDRKEMTWPRRLDQAGMQTIMLGKMDFCGDYQDGGFSQHRILRRRPAFAQIPLPSPYAARMPGYTRPDKRRHIRNVGARSSEIISDGGYIGEADDTIGNYDHDRLVTNWAVEALRNLGQRGQQAPWALFVGLLQPHWPFRVPEPYASMYLPDAYDWPVEALFPNGRLHPALQTFQRGLDLGTVTEEMLRKVLATYYGMVTCLDDMIGEMLAALEAAGQADNTHVIYTSDHGESLGEHGLFYKQCAYEGSVGVPLILRGPGITAGEACDWPVSLVDLYPTILDMAGLEAEDDCPGTSWLPLLRGETEGRPDWAFSEFHGNFFPDDWFMLVRDRFKYVHYVNHAPSLFDIDADPREINDLAARTEYADTLRAFAELLQSLLDPVAVSQRAKRDLGLIDAQGRDWTQGEKGCSDPAPDAWA